MRQQRQSERPFCLCRWRVLICGLAVSALCGRSQDSSPESWWSLQPLQKTSLPAVKNLAWPRSQIDCFVLAKLEAKNLLPSPEADPRTLLRRLYFDLIGLPPTPDEIQSFLADDSPGAYDRVVDRLLSSPRYGERWARHWLDVVHYADSHGHDQDRPRTNAWPYRDYLIRSFNEDKPYARFVQEQLAGDVLFPDDPNGVIATAFIAAGPWDESSQMHIMADTVDKKIAQSLDRDDMVTTATSTFLSSTVHCARCHDHKFDPISQEEYYGLQAVFSGVDRTDRPFDWDSAIHWKRQTLLKEKTALEVRQRTLAQTRLDAESEAALAAGQAAWEQRLREGTPWTTLNPISFISTGRATLTRQPDWSLLVSGEKPERDIYTIVVQTELKAITAFRLEVLPDDRLPKNGPGRAADGNFQLSEFEVKVEPASTVGAMTNVELRNATSDFHQPDSEADKAIDGRTNTAWGIFPAVGKPHAAVFETKRTFTSKNGLTLTFVLQQLSGKTNLLGRFRISATASPRPIRVDPMPANVTRVLAVTPKQRTESQKEELAAYYRTISPEIQTRLDEIDDRLSALPRPNLVYAAANNFQPQGKFTPAKVPRAIHVLARGEVTRSGQLAPPATLACVPGLSHRFELRNAADEGERRAAFARWVTDPKNALTWRSIVNRVWHYHFGRGIVETPNDFGRMGSPPTHPELLDWLANSFLENGGSLKWLHKLIVTSATYRQSSQSRLESVAVDADNRFLWRMNRARLDAESLRDSILFITGKLDLKMGGLPVKQFHFEDPNPGVTPTVDYGRFDVDQPESFRRSVYRWIYRTLPDPFMEVMDCPDASQLAPARNASVTPLQALSMLNNPFVVRQSEHFAERLGKSGDSLRERIELAYELAFGRESSAAEATALTNYARKHGLANVCRLILNSNEFMFVN
ncbi:MAG: DUF1553 domain-containing protein [Verrucomicrobia bacterium]|nr:DUF1553 domain-containing protein [Verrucomicrobiota bacterium]